jgi:hypothetical protein
LLISNKDWTFGYDYANILELEIESDPLLVSYMSCVA